MNPLLKLAHRQIWRRLPRRARRGLLLNTAAMVAPRITSGAPARPPIFIAGPLHSSSGLGVAARNCHDALRQHLDVPIYGIDLTRLLGYETDVADWAFVDGRHVIGEGTVILHVGGPLVALALARLGRRFIRGKRIIGHWFWELQDLPEDWRRGVPFVHEICVNSQFVGRAVATIAGDRPVHLVPHPVAAPPWRISAPAHDRPFTALVVFNVASSFARKNPCAAIRAFRSAFGERDHRVRLVVKYINAEHWPEAEDLMRDAIGDAVNIELKGGGVFDKGAMNELFERADVVLSLHRAEGLGLVMAEGMLRGLPVIATNWSGSTDFVTSETGIPIGYTLVPAHDPQGTYDFSQSVWAEPRVDDAAAALKRLRSDPDLRRRLGDAAAKAAAHHFNPARFAKSTKALLEA
jgi:glycosyltransferase involved in cell wall biosynthesis